MAIYHFSAKVIGRATGRSAVAAAAYRSASRLNDQRLDRHHDFTNKAGVVHSEVLLPDGAPEQWRDRETLWNAVEAGEVRKDAQLAREIEFAIPREMDEAQGIELARDFIAREFVARGMVADFNVHRDIGADGLAKPHAHVMLTMRAVTDDGFGAKVRDWNSTAQLERWRAAWAVHVNQRYADLDIDARVDHRSFAAQGIDLEPQHKIGPAGARRFERGEDAERADEHFAIARRNGERIAAHPEIGLDSITHQQSTFTVRDMARFAHRHSGDKDQFDQVLAAMKTSDHLVALGGDGRGEARYTTRGMIEVELRMAGHADRLDRAGHAVADAQVERAAARAAGTGLILSGEQRDALAHVTRGRDLGIVVGYAGAGKSAMLGVAREAWQAQGYIVRGAALSGIAAENLEHGSGIASRTLASLEHQWARDRERLRPGDVLVIDEAGMIGSRKMERVLGEAARAGAKVVLVGDPQQLQAIEAGAAFRSIAQRHGGAEITEVRRQRSDWQRGATRQLATGRTREALAAYARAGMIRGHATREGARAALIEGWDAERRSGSSNSRLILAHTREEVRALNELARDTLKRGGTIAAEIALETERGARLFGPNDRIMFLKNDRELGIKNDTLATVEQVSRHGMSARLDDGRSVAIDLKTYNQFDHGYAATVHKAQGVTVDTTHVLATPGLDQHSSYVALSRHRDSVHLHYGRDDFSDLDRLGKLLARECAKDSTLDYDRVRDRFVAERGYDRSAILDALARERTTDAAKVEHAPNPPKRGMFDGLRLPVERERADAAPTRFGGVSLGHDKQAATPGPKRSAFAGLRLSPPSPPAAADQDKRLAHAVQQRCRALEDGRRMIDNHLPLLAHQQAALGRTAHALDTVRPHATIDLGAAVRREPHMIGEAARGRTANAIRAMQLESEIRTNPELRADRFVRAWQQLRARRDALTGWENEDARKQIEGRMKTMAKGIAKDAPLNTALAKRPGDLGLRRDWSLEWRPGGPGDGGIGREITGRMQAPSVASALIQSLGRGRGIGL